MRAEENLLAGQGDEKGTLVEGPPHLFEQSCCPDWIRGCGLGKER